MKKILCAVLLLNLLAVAQEGAGDMFSLRKVGGVWKLHPNYPWDPPLTTSGANVPAVTRVGEVLPYGEFYQNFGSYQECNLEWLGTEFGAICTQGNAVGLFYLHSPNGLDSWTPVSTVASGRSSCVAHIDSEWWLFVGGDLYKASAMSGAYTLAQAGVFTTSPGTWRDGGVWNCGVLDNRTADGKIYLFYDGSAVVSGHTNYTMGVGVLTAGGTVYTLSNGGAALTFIDHHGTNLYVSARTVLRGTDGAYYMLAHDGADTQYPNHIHRFRSPTPDGATWTEVGTHPFYSPQYFYEGLGNTTEGQVADVKCTNNGDGLGLITYEGTEDGLGGETARLQEYALTANVSCAELLSWPGNVTVNVTPGNVASQFIGTSERAAFGAAFVARAVNGFPGYAWANFADSTDEKTWDFVMSGTALQLRAVSDNNSAANVGLEIDRSGTTITAVKLGAGGSANKAVCWKSDGKTLGYCSTVVDSGGACTCN